MTRYLYPKNLTAKANIWLWGMRDFIVLSVGVLLSIAAIVKFGWMIPAALTLCYGFLTIRKDEMTILSYLKYAIKYFLSEQQYYKWRTQSGKEN